MLPLDCPPPRRSKRLFAHWLGFSFVLHGALAACLLAWAYAVPRYVPAQSGGAMMVSLAGAGSSGAEAGGQQAGADDSATRDMPARQPKVEAPGPAEQKVAETAVPVKKQPEKLRRNEKKAAEKRVLSTQPQQEREPRPALRHSAAAELRQAAQGGTSAESGGDGGQGAAGVDSGPTGHVAGHGTDQARGQGEGNPQLQVVPWNAQGGPRFLRQAALRYPRAAQRRNLEGKVVVEAYLDVQGKLVRASVLHADHEDFAEAALACVQSSSFRPAQREGRAIPCVVRIPMLFVLKGF